MANFSPANSSVKYTLKILNAPVRLYIKQCAEISLNFFTPYHRASSIISCIMVNDEMNSLSSRRNLYNCAPHYLGKKQEVGAKLYKFLLDDTVRDNSFYHVVIIYLPCAT